MTIARHELRRHLQDAAPAKAGDSAAPTEVSSPAGGVS
jgi:hypothetical protein